MSEAESAITIFQDDDTVVHSELSIPSAVPLPSARSVLDRQNLTARAKGYRISISSATLDQLYRELHEQNYPPLEGFLGKLRKGESQQSFVESNVLLLKFLGDPFHSWQVLTTRISKTETISATSVRLTIELHDRKKVETTITKEADVASVSVSSQVNQGGRNLNWVEIVEQAIHALHHLQKDPSEKVMVDRVAFMENGEPLLNYWSVLQASYFFENTWGLKKGRITICTFGITPRIFDLARDLPSVLLAVKLDAPSQRLRKRQIPLAKRYSLDGLLEALDHFMAYKHDEMVSLEHYTQLKRPKRNVVIQYKMVEGPTCTTECAHELGELCRNREFIVNLVTETSRNLYGKSNKKPPSMQAINEFKTTVSSYGVECTIRSPTQSGSLVQANEKDEQPQVTRRQSSSSSSSSSRPRRRKLGGSHLLSNEEPKRDDDVLKSSEGVRGTSAVDRSIRTMKRRHSLASSARSLSSRSLVSKSDLESVSETATFENLSEEAKQEPVSSQMDLRIYGFSSSKVRSPEHTPETLVDMMMDSGSNADMNNSLATVNAVATADAVTDDSTLAENEFPPRARPPKLSILDKLSFVESLEREGIHAPLESVNALYEALHNQNYPPMETFIQSYRLYQQARSKAISTSNKRISSKIRSRHAAVPDEVLDFCLSNFVTLTSSATNVRHSENGQSVRFTTKLFDGHEVTTWISRFVVKRKWKAAVVVASQVGSCRPGCPYCPKFQTYTGSNLTMGEILEQLVHARKILIQEEKFSHPDRYKGWFRKGESIIINVAFMSNGEPLLNYEQVLDACYVLQNPTTWNLSKGRITISTSGVTPHIFDLAGELPDTILAVDLDAPTQDLRRKSIPLANRYGLDGLMEALDHYMAEKGEIDKMIGLESKDMLQRRKRVMIRYSMVEGETCTPECAHHLGKLCAGRNLIVNLVPYQRLHEQDTRRCPSLRFMKEFQAIVSSYNVMCAIRLAIGFDVDPDALVIHAERRRKTDSPRIPTASSLKIEYEDENKDKIDFWKTLANVKAESERKRQRLHSLHAKGDKPGSRRTSSSSSSTSALTTNTDSFLGEKDKSPKRGSITAKQSLYTAVKNSYRVRQADVATGDTEAETMSTSIDLSSGRMTQRECLTELTGQAQKKESTLRTKSNGSEEGLLSESSVDGVDKALLVGVLSPTDVSDDKSDEEEAGKTKSLNSTYQRVEARDLTEKVEGSAIQFGSIKSDKSSSQWLEQHERSREVRPSLSNRSHSANILATMGTKEVEEEYEQILSVRFGLLPKDYASNQATQHTEAISFRQTGPARELGNLSGERQYDQTVKSKEPLLKSEQRQDVDAITRRCFLEEGAIRTIQCWWRETHRRPQDRSQTQNEAATLIQSILREKIAKARVVHQKKVQQVHRQRLDKAVMLIQRFFRSISAKRLIRSLKEEKRQRKAVVVIQGAARSMLARLCARTLIKDREQQQNAAALVIQILVRSMLARIGVESLKMEKVGEEGCQTRAAIVIQSVLRSKSARNTVTRKRLEVIQHEKEQHEGAAVKIQTAVRSTSAKSLVRALVKERDQEQSKVIHSVESSRSTKSVIQTVKEERHLGESQEVKEHDGSVFLVIARGFSHIFEGHDHGEVMNQTKEEGKGVQAKDMAEGHKHHEVKQEGEERRVQAAIVIQCIVRAKSARSLALTKRLEESQREQKQREMAAAVVIQSAARAMSAKMLVKGLVDDKSQSREPALLIQGAATFGLTTQPSETIREDKRLEGSQSEEKHDDNVFFAIARGFSSIFGNNGNGGNKKGEIEEQLYREHEQGLEGKDNQNESNQLKREIQTHTGVVIRHADQSKSTRTVTTADTFESNRQISNSDGMMTLGEDELLDRDPADKGVEFYDCLHKHQYDDDGSIHSKSLGNIAYDQSVSPVNSDDTLELGEDELLDRDPADKGVEFYDCLHKHQFSDDSSIQSESLGNNANDQDAKAPVVDDGSEGSKAAAVVVGLDSGSGYGTEKMELDQPAEKLFGDIVTLEDSLRHFLAATTIQCAFRSAIAKRTTACMRNSNVESFSEPSGKPDNWSKAVKEFISGGTTESRITSNGGGSSLLASTTAEESTCIKNEDTSPDNERVGFVENDEWSQASTVDCANTGKHASSDQDFHVAAATVQIAAISVPSNLMYEGAPPRNRYGEGYATVIGDAGRDFSEEEEELRENAAITIQRAVRSVSPRAATRPHSRQDFPNQSLERNEWAKAAKALIGELHSQIPIADRAGEKVGAVSLFQSFDSQSLQGDLSSIHIVVADAQDHFSADNFSNDDICGFTPVDNDVEKTAGGRPRGNSITLDSNLSIFDDDGDLLMDDFEVMYFAAIDIQRWIRGYCAYKRFIELKGFALMIQSMFRARVSNNRTFKTTTRGSGQKLTATHQSDAQKIVAVMIIQKYYRRYLSMKRFSEVYGFALMLQSLVRGGGARAMVRDLKDDLANQHEDRRAEGVLVVQRLWRGFVGRKAYRDQKTRGKPKENAENSPSGVVERIQPNRSGGMGEPQANQDGEARTGDSERAVLQDFPQQTEGLPHQGRKNQQGFEHPAEELQMEDKIFRRLDSSLSNFSGEEPEQSGAALEFYVPLAEAGAKSSRAMECKVQGGAAVVNVIRTPKGVPQNWVESDGGYELGSMSSVSSNYTLTSSDLLQAFVPSTIVADSKHGVYGFRVENSHLADSLAFVDRHYSHGDKRTAGFEGLEDEVGKSIAWELNNSRSPSTDEEMVRTVNRERKTVLNELRCDLSKEMDNFAGAAVNVEMGDQYDRLHSDLDSYDGGNRHGALTAGSYELQILEAATAGDHFDVQKILSSVQGLNQNNEGSIDIGVDDVGSGSSDDSLPPDSHDRNQTSYLNTKWLKLGRDQMFSGGGASIGLSDGKNSYSMVNNWRRLDAERRGLGTAKGVSNYSAFAYNQNAIGAVVAASGVNLGGGAEQTNLPAPTSTIATIEPDRLAQKDIFEDAFFLRLTGMDALLNEGKEERKRSGYPSDSDGLESLVRPMGSLSESDGLEDLSSYKSRRSRWSEADSSISEVTERISETRNTGNMQEGEERRDSRGKKDII